MIIRRPMAVTKHKVNPYTSLLHFEGGVVKPFYMRGAIAFPDGNNEGFAIMAGQDLLSKILIIFEQFKFWTIETWLNGDGTIHTRDDGTGFDLGFMQFINDTFSLYKSATYFWGGQHIDVKTRYSVQVYKSEFKHPMFSLIEVPYVNEIGDGILGEKLNTEAFKGQIDSYLSKSVEQFVNTKMDAGAKNGAVLALETLLAGFEKIPWVDIKE